MNTIRRPWFVVLRTNHSGASGKSLSRLSLAIQVASCLKSCVFGGITSVIIAFVYVEPCTADTRIQVWLVLPVWTFYEFSNEGQKLHLFISKHYRRYLSQLFFGTILTCICQCCCSCGRRCTCCFWAVITNLLTNFLNFDQNTRLWRKGRWSG